MSVFELIKRLEQFPPDLQVMTGGFDDYGADFVETIETVEVVLNTNPTASQTAKHSRASELRDLAGLSVVKVLWIDF